VAQSFPSTQAILEAIATGRVKAGYVISTRGPWLAREHWPGKITFLPADESVDCFAITAAVRKADRDLKDAIDWAWNELDRSGRLAQVFARWYIPYERIAAAETNREPTP
jgi:ABC-type amino acid transport substrate-binding protein